MKIAWVVNQTDSQVIVACPYCDCWHRHGVASIGGTVVSHCFRGEYRINGDVVPLEVMEAAWKLRMRKLRSERLRRARRTAGTGEPPETAG